MLRGNLYGDYLVFKINAFKEIICFGGAATGGPMTFPAGTPIYEFMENGVTTYSMTLPSDTKMQYGINVLIPQGDVNGSGCVETYVIPIRDGVNRDRLYFVWVDTLTTLTSIQLTSDAHTATVVFESYAIDLLNWTAKTYVNPTHTGIPPSWIHVNSVGNTASTYGSVSFSVDVNPTDSERSGLIVLTQPGLDKTITLNVVQGYKETPHTFLWKVGGDQQPDLSPAVDGVVTSYTGTFVSTVEDSSGDMVYAAPMFLGISGGDWTDPPTITKVSDTDGQFTITFPRNETLDIREVRAVLILPGTGSLITFTLHLLSIYTFRMSTTESSPPASANTRYEVPRTLVSRSYNSANTVIPLNVNCASDSEWLLPLLNIESDVTTNVPGSFFYGVLANTTGQPRVGVLTLIQEQSGLQLQHTVTQQG